MFPLLWWGLSACAGAPDPCEPMCAQAAELVEQCLAVAGQDWFAAGYADAEDYEDACRTWAWEARLVTGDDARIDSECTRRETLLGSSDATCEEYAALDWGSDP